MKRWDSGLLTFLIWVIDLCSRSDDVVHALVEGISARLPRSRFLVVRWSPMLGSQLTSSYRVEVIVNRFEGPLDGAVTLKAQWGVLGKDRSFLLRKESLIVEQVNGKGYGGYVNAMSRAIDRLSREIAEGIISKS